MAHRNRWFTVFKNGGCFHGELLNNQMVVELCFFPMFGGHQSRILRNTILSRFLEKNRRLTPFLIDNSLNSAIIYMQSPNQTVQRFIDAAVVITEQSLSLWYSSLTMHDPPGVKMPIERLLYHIIGIIIVIDCYHIIKYTGIKNHYH